MNRSTNARMLTYYAVALLVVVGAVVLGLLVSDRAEGAPGWRPRCTSWTGAAHIELGEARSTVEERTGHGKRVWTDALTYGKRYATCDTTATLVVVYFRSDDTVASVLYATS